VGVILSGADQIVDAEGIKNYFVGEEMAEQGEISRRWEKGSFELLFYPDLDHATVFDTKERRKPVLDIIHRFVRHE